MKHLLLLLLTTACFAQNTKVTAYRMINWGSDGPCSLVNYIYEDEELRELGHEIISYATAESHDQKLINKLRFIKKQAHQWEQKYHGCNEFTIPGQRIPHMFVIEEGSFRDTLFTGYDNEDIIFPKEDNAYHDKGHLLQKALTGNIKKFFEHDFNMNAHHWGYKPDSISHQEVLYRSQPIFGLTEEKFKKEFPDAVFIRSVPISSTRGDYTEPIYKLGKDTLRFSKERLLQNITAYEKDNWQIGGIAPGDRAKKFESKYPASAPLKIIISNRFEDLERKYFYPLDLYKGDAGFSVENGVITHISIWFYVP